MDLKWKQQQNKSYMAVDKGCNMYKSPANQETVTAMTHDGFTGQGWTAEEALGLAEAKRDEKTNAYLETAVNELPTHVGKPPINDVLTIIEMEEIAKNLYKQINERVKALIETYGEGQFYYDVSWIKGQEKPFLKFELVDNRRKLDTDGVVWIGASVKQYSCVSTGLKRKPESLK